MPSPEGDQLTINVLLVHPPYATLFFAETVDRNRLRFEELNLGQTDPYSDEGNLKKSGETMIFFVENVFSSCSLDLTHRAIVMRFTSHRIADGRRLVC